MSMVMQVASLAAPMALVPPVAQVTDREAAVIDSEGGIVSSDNRHREMPAPWWWMEVHPD